MTIRKGEIGKTFRIAASFVMSGSTDLKITFTKPDSSVVTFDTAAGVTAPATPLVADPDLGNQDASTYFEFTNTTDVYDQAGEWTACGTYIDGTPKEFYTGQPKFTVLAGC